MYGSFEMIFGMGTLLGRKTEAVVKHIRWEVRSRVMAKGGFKMTAQNEC
jgi:hypothetical protein